MIPKRKTLTESWESYFTSCYGGKNIPKIQKDEVHQAFFAGALSMMEAIRNIPDDLPEEEMASSLLEYSAEVENTLRTRLRKILPLGHKPSI